MALPSIALPGQLLGPADKYLPGPGTHFYNQQIYASIAGPVTSAPAPPRSSKKTPSLTSISVSSPSNSASSNAGTPLLPTVSDTVLARITRLSPRYASCAILSIGSRVCAHPFSAQIRREDVRAFAKDSVRIDESFRVGDIVRATVISLGDQGGYYLATESNELGVVLAKNKGLGGEEGAWMVPVSWCEVWDRATGNREKRKVAKPF